MLDTTELVSFMKKDNNFSAVIRPIPKCDNLLDAQWAQSSMVLIQNSIDICQGPGYS